MYNSYELMGYSSDGLTGYNPYGWVGSDGGSSNGSSGLESGSSSSLGSFNDLEGTYTAGIEPVGEAGASTGGRQTGQQPGGQTTNPTDPTRQQMENDFNKTLDQQQPTTPQIQFTPLRIGLLDLDDVYTAFPGDGDGYGVGTGDAYGGGYAGVGTGGAYDNGYDNGNPAGAFGGEVGDGGWW